MLIELCLLLRISFRHTWRENQRKKIRTRKQLRERNLECTAKLFKKKSFDTIIWLWFLECGEEEFSGTKRMQVRGGEKEKRKAKHAEHGERKQEKEVDIVSYY